MGKLSVSASGDSFVKDGRPFFYLADTAWMAFSVPTDAEWEAYLAYREEQGFNVLQISVLPVLHDMSCAGSPDIGFRFHNGVPDFYEPDPAYFARAERRLAAARAHGFTPMLVLLWCNYIPDTWAAARLGESFTMPMDALRPYIAMCLRRFASYEPVYAVSGDTNFETARVCAYYREELRLVRELSPGSLTTMHLTPSGTDLPREFEENPDLDFYMYQSGHNPREADNPSAFARHFLSCRVRRPIVNGEPCYEGHGHANVRERFDAFEVRSALWRSLLSGAKAGVAYGAHGVWSFHRREMAFLSESFSGRPYPWDVALRFPGAWDAAFARWIFETFGLFDVAPCDEIAGDMPGACLACSDQHAVIYAPYDFDLAVDRDLSGYDFTLFVLAEKKIARPHVRVENGKTVFSMHGFNSDALLLGVRR